MKNSNTIYSYIKEQASVGAKMFAVLIDPDKQNESDLLKTIHECNQAEVDFFFVGGSIITHGDMDKTVRTIKENSLKPIIIFPGHPEQISKHADAILFLSLTSGRNPEFLIGHHVTSAPIIKSTQLEVIPTGYLLVDCGTTTTAIYVSDTNPIPYTNTTIAANTALAGEYLGLKMTYIDGGSGAKKCISNKMISKTKSVLDGPLIIGGGIRDVITAKEIYKSGADIIVVGNGAETNLNLIPEIAEMKHALNVSRLSV